MLSTPEDWSFYIKTRAGQKFTAIQWAATQWRGAPKGDNAGRLAYSGVENIALNLDYFRRLDQKSAALNQAGLLSVPVMLWAFDHSAEDQVSPGVSLPDAQAIVLARYMMGRWGADAVLWLLNGDGDYRGPKAERWRNIGRAVFQEVWHAPVSLHPGGGIWVMDNFRDESWISVSGYQSGHNDSEKNSRWITSGEPAVDWKRDRARTSISLEGPYESPARPDRTPAPEFLTRRNHYWSLLNAPTAGITYGVSGVWSWSDGTCPVPGHGPVVGPHWKTVLHLPAAEQMRYLAEFFQGIDYWRLRPEPAVLGAQPGVNAIGRFISAAQSPEKNLTVLYIPEDRSVTLVSTAVPARFSAEWFNPRTGDRSTASAEPEGLAIQFLTPAAGDWVLLLRAK